MFSARFYTKQGSTSILSQDLTEVKNFISKHLDVDKTEIAMKSLIKQSMETNNFPNVVYFLDENNSTISIEEALNSFKC